MREELSVLSAFLTVAEERSFTRAAKRLNISTSGLSHAIRRLEEQVGVRLLTRTTRSVAPTEAGQQLIAHLAPALDDVRQVLTQISNMRTRPVGRVRLLCCRLAMTTVLVPKLTEFVLRYPDVELDITTDDEVVDLAAAGYDAAIQFGEYIAQDMMAVRVSPDLRPAVVAAPSYFESRPKPTCPRDLLDHQCIRFRHRGQSVYKWELDKGQRVGGPRRERARDPRRPESRDPACVGRRGGSVAGGRSGCGASRERCPGTRPGGLVATLSRLLPVLPESTAVSGAHGLDRDAAGPARERIVRRTLLAAAAPADCQSPSPGFEGHVDVSSA